MTDSKENYLNVKLNFGVGREHRSPRGFLAIYPYQTRLKIKFQYSADEKISIVPTQVLILCFSGSHGHDIKFPVGASEKCIF